MLAECKITVFDFAAELFDRASHRFKAILRIRDQAGECFGRVTNLVKKTGHVKAPFYRGGRSEGRPGQCAHVQQESSVLCKAKRFQIESAVENAACQHRSS